ncbi:flagellar export protein FliJ [Desulfobacula sp.]|uniref:flagellar export protein FliJ n=1 Tax=Desulfobacula sp. TaxID=2593537 RepID=UPI0026152A53|nr:flagellar export protein FliJ [Desulfobacula sp.]
MKRFEFKLQPLLNYREYLERIAQQNTARANMAVKACEEQITHLKQTYDQKAKKIDALVTKGVGASEFRQHHYYLDMVESRIKEETSRKIELDKGLKEKLLELKKKSVDKKVMELYRERLKTEYTQDVMKIEQKELDEISFIKTARTRSDEI